jgi:hypothetical protein
MSLAETSTEPKLADRMSRLGTESAFEVLARARALEAQGRKIIHLGIGEPDFDTPAHITEAAVEALRAGFTHYVAVKDRQNGDHAGPGDHDARGQAGHVEPDPGHV